MAKSIPVFDAYVDNTDETGVNEIAFVANPAVLVKGIAFAAQSPKQRIAAPILIPMNVYRNSDEDGEYEVRFTVEEIENIGKDFQSKSKTQAFNLEHETGVIAPAYLLETWFVGQDPKADRSYSEFGIEVPTGTWMGVSQVTDVEYYNKLVENGQTAFSIEGFLGLKITQNKQYKKMNKQFKLADVKTADGSMLFIDGDIAIGTSVFLITPSGDKVIPLDGYITLADGTVISVAGGVINEISTINEEGQDIAEVEAEAEMACKPQMMAAPVEVVPAVEVAPVDVAPMAPMEPMYCTHEEVAKMIEDKMAEMVAKIAELQTKVDNFNAPVEDVNVMKNVDTKMSFIARHKLLISKK